jgi:hypothetical protein
VDAGVDRVALQLRMVVRVPVARVGIEADELGERGLGPDGDQGGRLGDRDLLVSLKVLLEIANLVMM